MIRAVIFLSLLGLISCQSESFKVVTGDSIAPEKVSCLDHLTKNPGASNGLFQINHDQDELTPMITVYCDMSAGGWTRIIKDHTTSVADLGLFGDTSEIAATFYSDPAMGIGWGEPKVTGGANADCSFTDKFVMDKLWNYTEIKMEVSATYSVATSPDNSNGYIYINNDFTDDSNSIASFVDAWTADASGSNAVVVNGVEIRNRNASASDLIAFPVPIVSAGDRLKICIGGELPMDYNKRYINSLWIK